MTFIPELAYTVHVEGRPYRAGTIPPVRIARQITNRAAWVGNVLPDLDELEDLGAADTSGSTTPTATEPSGSGDVPKGGDDGAGPQDEDPAGGDPALAGLTAAKPAKPRTRRAGTTQ